MSLTALLGEHIGSWTTPHTFLRPMPRIEKLAESLTRVSPCFVSSRGSHFVPGLLLHSVYEASFRFGNPLTTVVALALFSF
jgi:hypothetical protein